MQSSISAVAIGGLGGSMNQCAWTQKAPTNKEKWKTNKRCVNSGIAIYSMIIYALPSRTLLVHRVYPSLIRFWNHGPTTKHYTTAIFIILKHNCKQLYYNHHSCFTPQMTDNSWHTSCSISNQLKYEIFTPILFFMLC